MEPWLTPLSLCPGQCPPSTGPGRVAPLPPQLHPAPQLISDLGQQSWAGKLQPSGRQLWPLPTVWARLSAQGHALRHSLALRTRRTPCSRFLLWLCFSIYCLPSPHFSACSGGGGQDISLFPVSSLGQHVPRGHGLCLCLTPSAPCPPTGFPHRTLALRVCTGARH